ncbi:MAG TPA: TOBE domain-containing protein, partial [Candidatus Thermoplasmatota archaeon]|nr:TOBE domain-containing protein [Candidatus Thermoplasmatota archaeon]
TLHVAGRHRPGPAIVRVPAEAVALSRRAQAGTSARNAIPMAVESLRDEGDGLWRARLVAGALRLEALVTRGAVRDLRLRAGSRVVATVKATAIGATPIPS